MNVRAAGPAEAAAEGTGLVLLTLASGQFLMTLDMSVMNVSIATVANELGTTVTGIQTAITLYTLIMATLMITGGKIGSMIGRRRAFGIGCVIYAAGSLTTALAPNLAVLILGWSLLEGIGAALIMPAIVALVACNFPPEERRRAYGMVAAAGAIAVAAGPLIGGAATTYFSWRLVFLGEVLIAALILVLSRKLTDAAPESRRRLDLVGTALSIVGLGAFVYGILRTSEWGWILPKPGAPDLLGISASAWLMAAGLLVVGLFLVWENRVGNRGGEPLLRPIMLRNRHLTGGLSMFLFQYLLQAGVFFVIPLFLSVVLGLSALETGVRLVPLSLALLAAAVGVPRLLPRASPRLVVRVGLLFMSAGIALLLSGIDLAAGASVVAVPMVLMGVGIGSLASQLGAVTVSSVPTEESSEVGGLQNTAMNLGASVGSALAGSVLIGALTSSLLAGVESSPQVCDALKSRASVELAAGVPFLSDADANAALKEAGVTGAESDAFLVANEKARIAGLDAALAILGLVALGSLLVTGRIPNVPPGQQVPP